MSTLAQTFGAPIATAHDAPDTSVFPSQTNFADNESVVQDVLRDIYPVIQWARWNRTNIEEEWRDIIRMEYMQHDSGRRYIGRAAPYIPIHAKNLDQRAEQIVAGLFPTEDYLGVVDTSEYPSPGSAETIRHYMQWELEQVAHLRWHMEQFVRQLDNFGNSVLKIWYEKDVLKGKKNTGRGFLRRLASGQTHPVFAPSKSTELEGLRVSTRSMLYFYLWPLSAASLGDATLCFEDIDLSLGFLREMGRKGKWHEVEKAEGASPPPNHLVTQTNLITTINGAAPPSVDLAVGQSAIGKVVVVTEVWTFMKLPPSAYLAWEDKEEPVPVKLTMAGQHVLEVRRNPFNHQRPPYLFLPLNTAPGFIYGTGTGKRTRPMQYLTNDFAAQTSDTGTYALNPINKVNPGMIVGPLPKIRPNAVWYGTDIEAMHKFDRPPLELIGAGQSMIQLWMGMAQDVGGAAPPTPQGMTGKAAKTATGAQILQRNATVPLRGIVSKIEEVVLVPAVRLGWSLAQQYRTEPTVATRGTKAAIVTPDDLAADANFHWLASNQMLNQQQRALQASQFLTAVPPLVPLLQAQGKTFDPEPLLEQIYTGGLGFRGFDRIIKPLQAPVAAPPSQVPEGAGGAPPGPPGSEEAPRSALEQIPGMGPQDMAEGEGNEMSEVRHNAAILAAQAGRDHGTEG